MKNKLPWYMFDCPACLMLRFMLLGFLLGIGVSGIFCALTSCLT